MGSSGGRAKGGRRGEVKARDSIQVMKALVESVPVDRRGRGRRINEGIDGGVAPISGADGFPECIGASETAGFLAGHGKG